MSGISTHVLDLAQGKPAANVAVRLERKEFGSWKELAARFTNGDGRCDEILPPNAVSPGTYRLIFDSGSYQSEKGLDGLYPEIILSFVVGDGSLNYHLPLLLSPHGYTTYRGS
jgi:5-hydroxyisourate hydrolase